MSFPAVFAEISPQYILLSALIVAISTCIAAWAWIVVRWRQKRPVAPYQPRRPVPWRAIDLVLIVLFFFLAVSAAMNVVERFFGPETMPAAAANKTDQSDATHAIGQLVGEGNPWVLLLCFVAAAVVAPAGEEFFFRVVFQGWLEAVERRWWPKRPRWLRAVPRGAVPIFLSALMFAAMHFRLESPKTEAGSLILQQVADVAAKLLTFAFAIELLRQRARATAADFGLTPQKFLGDIKLGLAVFAAVGPLIYAMQFGLFLLLPKNIAPDPIPVFFLALALGILYYRTHRIMPLIVLHAALNFTSLMLAWLCSQQ